MQGLSQGSGRVTGGRAGQAGWHVCHSWRQEKGVEILRFRRSLSTACLLELAGC